MKIRKLKKGKPLELTNKKNKISIFFLGTGSAFSKKNYQTNFIIIKGNTHLLVDCGTTSPKALTQLKSNVMNIKNYYITHSHADHIGGLEEVMLCYRYIQNPELTNKKPKIIINKHYKKLLWNFSLKGGNAFSETKNGKPLEFEDFWDVLELKKLKGFKRETWGYQFENLDLKMPRTCHIPDQGASWKDSIWSTGIIIDEKIFISSDTKYDPDLIFEYDKKYKIEIIFHDCQLFPGGIHANLEELKNLPKNIKSKMILMHYGDNIDDYLNKIKQYGFHSIAKKNVFYDF